MRITAEISNCEISLKNNEDIARVIVKYVGSNNILLSNSYKMLNITATGGIDILGLNNIQLVGGAITFWIKANGKSNEGMLEIVLPETGERIIDIIRIVEA